MWETMLDFFEVLPLIISVAVIVAIIVSGLLFLRAWIKVREFDKDKSHWRE